VVEALFCPATHASESLAMILRTHQKGGQNQGGDFVGGTPTDATGAVALPTKSLMIGANVTIVADFLASVVEAT
jgi:hypothetical protein